MSQATPGEPRLLARTRPSRMAATHTQLSLEPQAALPRHHDTQDRNPPALPRHYLVNGASSRPRLGTDSRKRAGAVGRAR
jgi:hypothetical protein